MLTVRSCGDRSVNNLSVVPSIICQSRGQSLNHLLIVRSTIYWLFDQSCLDRSVNCLLILESLAYINLEAKGHSQFASISQVAFSPGTQGELPSSVFGHPQTAMMTAILHVHFSSGGNEALECHVTHQRQIKHWRWLLEVKVYSQSINSNITGFTAVLKSIK